MTDERTERERLAAAIDWAVQFIADDKATTEARRVEPWTSTEKAWSQSVEKKLVDLGLAAALLTERTGERERSEYVRALIRKGSGMVPASPAPEPEWGEGARCYFVRESHGVVRRCTFPAGHDGDHQVPMPWGPALFAASPEPAGRTEIGTITGVNERTNEAFVRLRGGLDLQSLLHRKVALAEPAERKPDAWIAGWRSANRQEWRPVMYAGRQLHPTREAALETIDYEDERFRVIPVYFGTPPAPAGEWRPIATAPKDGTVVLLYIPYDGRWAVTPAIWVGADGAWREGDGSFVTKEATHWMPLPAAPQDATGEEVDRG